MLHKRIGPLIAATLFVGFVPLVGFAAEFTVGDKVVVIKRAKLKIPNATTGEVYVPAILTVKKVNGTWLWIEYLGKKGWISRDHVVPKSDALQFFTNQIRRNPDQGLSYCHRGQYLENLKRYADAANDYSQIIRIYPNYSGSYRDRAFCRVKLNQFDAAMEDFSTALRLGGSDDRVYWNRGRLFQKMDQHVRAIRDFDKAVRLDPSAYRYYQRGISYVALDLHSDAVKDFDIAIREKPNHVLYLCARGKSLVKMKLYDRALADFEKAYRVEPTYSPAEDGLKSSKLAMRVDRLYRRLGKPTKVVALSSLKPLKSYVPKDASVISVTEETP